MSDVEDAASFSSFADAKSHDSDGEAEGAPGADDGGHPDDVARGGDAGRPLVGSGAEATDTGASSEGDDAPSEPTYDESLPDGRSFRRRRRSVIEVDELADEKRDLEAALAFKTEGNRHFGLGDYDTAVACYTECLRHLPRGSASDAQVAIGYSNRAACHLMSGRLEETVYDCDRALEFNAGYAKALARRASALEKLGKLEEASKGATEFVAPNHWRDAWVVPASLAGGCAHHDHDHDYDDIPSFKVRVTGKFPSKLSTPRRRSRELARA